MARTRKPASSDRPVSAVRHVRDRRPNIPTAELESFAEDAERRPQVVRYPRDPSLDPQLVWKGKDEQDAQDLEAPAVPIYIQEQIAPQALIEDLRVSSSAGAAEQQLNLFGDFNSLEFEQRVEFYEHSQHWTNRLILGDSLLVMTSLAEKEGLKGKVQMLYVDPPYGIKFGSNWQVSTRRRDVRDGRAEDATRQPEQVRAFRDTWELGIHSYLSYLRDRLVAARALLSESGSVFVQIGDENVHLVRSVLDEVFGGDNFCNLITFKKTASASSDNLSSVADYIIWYARDRARMKYRMLYQPRTIYDDVGSRYTRVELPDGSRRMMTSAERQDPEGVHAGTRIYRHDNLTSQRPAGAGDLRAYVFDNVRFTPGAGTFKTDKTGMDNLAWARRLAYPTHNSLAYMRYLDDFPFAGYTNIWTDTQTGAFTDEKVYVVQTSTKVIQRCVLMTTDPGDLVLDPTCGSGTTAYVAEQWGRRWITIDTSRVALALARTRLMAARYPYYLLADSPEGIRKEAALAGQAPPSPLPPTERDVSKGFVYERVPHVTLKSIAQNPDIHEGMSRDEIDAAIARHAETAILYDRLYTDPKVVRVSGPFTVESLSPHCVLSTDPESEGRNGQRAVDDAVDATRFVDQIIANLQKAGVQNTVKQERLTFDRLESWPGEYVQAEGDYTEDGKSRRVAICIGPEHGTVNAELVREAAKEASRFADLLVLCGFAFDAYARETQRMGRLIILTAQMNPDLMMPELLKKTGAGNLFMVFGEPDIEIQHGAENMLTVEIRGVDVYDPTTGVLRSHSTDDIACWFIDTAYNEESFFVRHAYFLGGNDPYERLKRALRADVNEAAWASLYSATSRPFPRPASGKIAVKVINHYGDEVLKVYRV
jgi:adenine-specific DNA-methyltransferase